jgi:peptidoglycan-N-acetylglucosamine deacetylase
VKRRLVKALLLSVIYLPALAQSRTVAITVDDLVCASCGPAGPDGTVASEIIESANERLVAGLKRAHIPVTGFVITQTVEKAGVAGTRSLQMWLDAGFDLGSHSYSHPNFASITTEEMEADIERADAMLRPLLVANHRALQFFRFPYNGTGNTQAKHDTLAAYLSQHGYRVATCTIDNTDWEYAQAYVRAIGARDKGRAERILRAYLDYTASEIDFYAALNRRVLGYEPPQVMLIHDSMLNAGSIDGLLGLFRSRGYHFVSLTQAQSDPAYSIPDTYVTRYGPMWGYRWAAERNVGHLGLTEPDPPGWVSDYANGKSAANAPKPGSP